jgi:hypothetical protein
MSLIISPGKTLGRDGGSFQECSTQGMFETVTLRYGRYCTIRDHETVPPTSKPNRKWVQIYRTPDNTE